MIHLALASVLHDVNGIINCTTAFVRSRWKWHAIWLLGHVTPVVPTAASHDADDIINGTTAFVTSRCLKSNETWLLWSCDTICTCITLCWQYCQWHFCIHYVNTMKWGAAWVFWSCAHVTPLLPVLVPCDAKGIINSITAFVRLRWLKLGAT